MDATASSSARPPPRRPVQACSACKKSKVRCEIIELLDLDKDVKCHRCSTLGHPCSFSEMDKSLFLSYVASAPQKFPDVHEQLKNQTEHPQAFMKFILDKEAAAIAPPAMGFGIAPLDELGDRLASSLESNFWSYFKDNPLFDWSTPLSTIRELLRPTADSDPSRHSPPLPITPDSSLSNILSRTQIDELLETFAVRYIPWLNFSLVRDSDGTVLEIACCNVASRHLAPNYRSLVSARLQRLTENTVAKLVFNNSQSLEAVQALIILALWCPLGFTDSGMWDARVLIASAVSIAMNMRLNEASGKVIELKRTRGPESQLVAMMNKARLWTALTLTESLLCLGSGRTPLACRNPSDIEFIPVSVVSPDTPTECRDCRIRFLGEMLNASESAAKIHLNGQTPTPTDIDNWYDAKMKVLGTLDRLRRLILPLEVLSDYDQFYFHMLLMTLHSCRLQILYSSLYEVRTVYNSPGSSPAWYTEFKPHGMNAITTWGRECLQLAEATLVGMLQTDVQYLSSCPDVIFCMLTFAADLVFAVKRFIFQVFAVATSGSMDKLLKKSMQHLSAAAPSEDHPASGAARVISAMLTTTDDFVKHGMMPPPLFQSPAPFQVPLQEQQRHSEVLQSPMHPQANTDLWTQFMGYDPMNDIQSPFIQS